MFSSAENESAASISTPIPAPKYPPYTATTNCTPPTNSVHFNDFVPCLCPAHRAIGLENAKINVANASSHGITSRNVFAPVKISSIAPRLPPVSEIPASVHNIRRGICLKSDHAAAIDAADPGQIP